MKTSEKDTIIELLKEYPIIKTTCQKANIARQTFYRWIEEDKIFEKKVKKALKEGTLLVNDTAEENLITMINEKNLSAMKYWLRHHHDDYSRNGFIPVIYAKK